MDESGDLAGALAFLEAERRWFLNVTDWEVARASLMTRLGRFDEAEPIWRELLVINPENYCFHRGLQSCLLRVVVPLPLSGSALPCTDTTLTPDQVSVIVATVSCSFRNQHACICKKNVWMCDCVTA